NIAPDDDETDDNNLDYGKLFFEKKY
ncbi:unnamed protein product, partial [Rotaria sp. Silwood2]